jgi:hypothetical protein
MLMYERGSIFAKCTLWIYEGFDIEIWNELQLDVREYELKLEKHLLHQESCKSLYHTWRSEFVWLKDEFLCVIHDKMGHVKIAPPRL